MPRRCTKNELLRQSCLARSCSWLTAQKACVWHQHGRTARNSWQKVTSWNHIPASSLPVSEIQVQSGGQSLTTFTRLLRVFWQSSYKLVRAHEAPCGGDEKTIPQCSVPQWQRTDSETSVWASSPCRSPALVRVHHQRGQCQRERPSAYRWLMSVYYTEWLFIHQWETCSPTRWVALKRVCNSWETASTHLDLELLGGTNAGCSGLYSHWNNLC